MSRTREMQDVKKSIQGNGEGGQERTNFRGITTRRLLRSQMRGETESDSTWSQVPLSEEWTDQNALVPQRGLTETQRVEAMRDNDAR